MLISANTGLHSYRPGKSRFDILGTMNFMAEAGFEAVDVNFCGTVYDKEDWHDPILDGDWRENSRRLRDRMALCGLVASHTHLPFRYNYPTDKKYYEDPMMKRSIEATALIGAPYAVCHPILSDNGETLVEKTIEIYAPLAKFARECGVVLAMENLFTTTPLHLIEISDKLNCGVCWDAGHAHILGLKQYESITALGNRIKALHLHDNYGEKDNHNAPYFGNIDWREIVDALADIGYTGTFNYEVIKHNIPDELYMDHAKYLVKAARIMLGR